jgi:cytochrome c oxidase assembly protein subunit 15
MIKTKTLPASRPVGQWILLGVFMLIVQVILGGITRLTGSGLSITEWNVFTGILPPLNGKQWLAAFEKYRETPQFHLLNADFSLSDFKFIFFWEWFHRLWARLIAVVFVLGFATLLCKGEIKRGMIKPLLGLFVLGAAQGAIGWIMVASGLTGDAIYVEPTRLALHFVFALVLICFSFWFALQLLVPSRQLIADRVGRRLCWAILVTLFIQLLFGAMMAGLKTANTAPTWPTINGDWIPSSLFQKSPVLLNLIDNPLTIQFIHRSLGYLIFALTGLWSIRIYTISAIPVHLYKYRWVPLFLIFIQILLGVAALLTSRSIVPNHWVAFDWIAQLHQVNALLFMLSMMYMLYLVRRT